MWVGGRVGRGWPGAQTPPPPGGGSLSSGLFQAQQTVPLIVVVPLIFSNLRLTAACCSLCYSLGNGTRADAALQRNCSGASSDGAPPAGHMVLMGGVHTHVGALSCRGALGGGW